MKRNGFTLIEILVVIVIIAILAAIILGLANNAQNTAARKKAEAEISSISAFITDQQMKYGRVPQWRAGVTEADATTELAKLLKDAKHSSSNFTDPWGRGYHYLPSSAVTFYLWSDGPDTNNLSGRIGNPEPAK